MDRYSLSKGNEWISLPPAVFAIIITIARSKIDHVRNAVNMNGLVIEVIKILDNFLIVYTSKTRSASIIIEGDVMSSVIEIYDDIKKIYRKL